MVERCIVYARVSTDDQRDNFSIPTQIEGCRKVLVSKKYVWVGNRFVDLVTGKDCQAGPAAIPAFVDDFSSRELQRPGLEAAYSFLETEGADVVLIHSLDRLARDPYIRKTLELEFEQKNVRVEYALGNYEDTPEGEVRKDLDATFAKWENAKRVERCNRGKLGKAGSNLYVAGMPPYGYRIDKVEFGGLRVESEKAEVVRMIFRLYVQEGQSIRGIGKYLNQVQAVTQRGHCTWAISTISRILHTTHYAGFYYYNRRKRTRKGMEFRDQDQWIRMECTSIIDLATFQEAQQRLNDNKDRLRKQPHRFYLLSGMVFCEECGRAFGCEASKAGLNRRKVDAQNYRHRISQGHCRNHTISARILDTLVWDQITGFLLNPENLRAGFDNMREQHLLDQRQHRIQIEELEEECARYESIKANLLKSYIDPALLISRDEFIQERKLIDEKIQKIQNKMTELSNSAYVIPTPEEMQNLADFSEVIRERMLGSEWSPTPENMRYLLELLHVNVRINQDGKIHITGWFGEIDNVLSISSTNYENPPPPLPVRACRAAGL